MVADEDELWRKSLKKGDKLDILKKEIDPIPITGWSTGKIEEINGETIKVSYDGEAEDFDKTLPLNTPDISPYASHTGGSEWKEQVKKNSIIDCMHSSYNWAKSTILDIKDFNEGKNNRSVPKIFVGYRYYLDSNENNESKAFSGLSAKMDEWLKLYSLRVQQQGAITRIGIIKLGNPDATPEKPEFDDSSDILMNSVRNKEIFAILRPEKAKSELLARLLNNFGKENGFQKILQKISNREKIISLGNTKENVIS